MARASICAGALVVIAACGGGGGGGGQIVPVVFNITTSTLNDGVLGVAYSQALVVTGGTGTKTFSVSAGTLPPGLTLNTATGAITGLPIAPIGTANFTITVTDSSTPPQSDSQVLTIDIVNPLTITSVALPGTTIGAAYNRTITATGGTAPYTFSVSAGALPAGLTLNATSGAVTGPATAAATSQNLTIRVTDSSSPSLAATQAQSIAITLQITTTSLPDATAGAAYTAALQARGGTPPYVNWTRTAGSMPAGIADPDPATGDIDGTPSLVCTATTSTFTARVSDSAVPPALDSQAGIDITVNPGPALNITTTSLPSGVVGTPYNVVVQVSGGAPPYAFSTTGTLPSQLAPINGLTGRINGTPDTVETRNFSVTVTDSCGAMDTQALSIAINAVSLGRNDNEFTATPLGNGSFAASISPSGDPNTIVQPDQDFYVITTTAASTVTIDIDAVVIGSPLDSVIEIVDILGFQLQACGSPAFTSTCENDDEGVPGTDVDSILQIRVAGPTTFYVRVVDFRGDARPDLKYNIIVSGVN